MHINTHIQALSGLVGAALLATTLTAAPARAADLSYTYVQGGYQSVDLDSPSVDGDGVFLGGSVQVSQSLFLSADVDYTDFNRGIDTRNIELGLGVRLPAAPDVDLVLRGGYVDARVDTRVGDFDDDGYFVSGGARWQLNDQVELHGAVRYVDLDDSGDDVGLALGVVVNVRPRVALLAGGEFSDDADVLNIGFRYHFDR